MRGVAAHQIEIGRGQHGDGDARFGQPRRGCLQPVRRQRRQFGGMADRDAALIVAPLGLPADLFEMPPRRIEIEVEMQVDIDVELLRQAENLFEMRVRVGVHVGTAADRVAAVAQRRKPQFDGGDAPRGDADVDCRGGRPRPGVAEDQVEGRFRVHGSGRAGACPNLAEARAPGSSRLCAVSRLNCSKYVHAVWRSDCSICPSGETAMSVAKAEPKGMSDAQVVEAYLTASMIPHPEAAAAYMKRGTIITFTGGR